MKHTVPALVLAATMGVTALTACSSQSDSGSNTDATVQASSLDEARQQNRARQVDSRFGDSPSVVQDLSGTGVDASKLFFDSSETAVVAAPSSADMLRAASLAVTLHAPVLRLTAAEGSVAEVNGELRRLGVNKVLLVGPVAPGATDGIENLQTVAAPTTAEGAGTMTSQDFSSADVRAADEQVASVAKLGEKPVLLNAAFTEEDAAGPKEAGAVADFDAHATADDVATDGDLETTDAKDGSDEKVESFPVQSARDGAAAPIVVAAPSSPVLGVANARAYGAPVRVMDYPDPRINEDAALMTAGLEDQAVVGLGRGFGANGEEFAGKIRLSQEETAELPGGGNLVFPGRRMVALYGHPSGDALGVMGAYDPQGAVSFARELVEQYQAIDTQEPVIPAFEIIATIASSEPGPDNDYSNEAEPEELLPYIDAVTEAGGYVVLDLQPGRAHFLNQAKRYEELLKRPNVGLALDPEWRIGDDELPLQRVGSVEANEVNEVSEWLANLVAENNLPQKAFVLHQFQMQMLRDRETIRTDHPELAYVLHADGHGTPDLKFETWDVLRQELDPNFFMAWKNFFDEDSPMFTPEQTFDVNPRPWFISYQ